MYLRGRVDREMRTGADEAAEQEFEAALRLSPRLYAAYFLYGVHEVYLKGDLDRGAYLF